MSEVNAQENKAMVRDSLQKISRMKRSNQWFFENIKPFLGKKILDAGCGNGNITVYFKDKELVIAMDNDIDIINDLRSRLFGFANLRIMKCDMANSEFVVIAKRENIDTVVCINTLEHIKEDAEIIKNFYDILPDGGNLILLVPAHRFLYSALDEAAGHFRRYNKKELSKKLIENRFSILHISYLNMFGAFGWFLLSKVMRRRKFDESSISMYEGLANFFILIEKTLGAPFGSSLLIVGNKFSRTK